MRAMYILFWLLVLPLIGCHTPEPSPDPATLISGDYIAVTELNTGLVYPINGKSFSLRIQRVSKDTVEVAIQSEPNNGFSPGQNLFYRKAHIGPSSGLVAKQIERGHYAYTVYLTPRAAGSPDSLTDVLLFYTYGSNQYVDYHYRPVGANPEWDGEEITRLQRF